MDRGSGVVCRYFGAWEGIREDGVGWAWCSGQLGQREGGGAGPAGRQEGREAGELGRSPGGQGGFLSPFSFFCFLFVLFFLFILSCFTLVTFYFSFCKIYT